MRTYVSLIGYNSTSVVRPILSRGLDSGDKIVLLRPDAESDEHRASEAVGDVERLLTEIEPDVTLSLEYLTYDEYSTAVLECGDLLADANGEVIVNLGGGPRDLLVPLTTATFVYADSVSTALSFSDIDGSVRELELPSITASIPGNALETMLTIAEYDDPVSVPELTATLEVSKSSITRHINRLEEENLLSTEKHGKVKVVRVTFSGELLLSGRELSE